MTGAAKRANVAVAMSGGVDSSAAAALLCVEGHRVVGLAMRLPLYADDGSADACGSSGGLEDARRVAGRLGISFYALDFRERFERTVLDDFCRSYAEGQTPNPCVRCNEWLKFGALLDKALALGADFLATGHYVRKARHPATGRWVLLANPEPEDQSYFLYRLSQAQLERCLFPLAGLSKDTARSLARRLGLPVHDKRKSQDLCFLRGGNYAELLRQRCPQALRPGPILHVSGAELGTHCGIGAYTVGQRHGLGIAHGEPLYVVGLSVERNAVIVGEKEHLFRTQLAVREVCWMAGEPPGPVSARVKIRYNHVGAEASVSPLEGGRAAVTFARPQMAPTPGQSAVFYDGEIVLGGGIIENFPG